MRRIALRLQYDGAAFAGSQWQPHLPTVQGALEDAIRNLTGEPAGDDPDFPCHAVSLAGRTDAGVHAQGQIASFLTDRDLSPRRFVRGLNHFLPPAAAVQDAWEAPLSFDPRRMAVEREYRYRLRIAEQRQPLHADRAWIVPPPFCPAAASAALHRLRGRRNFAAFAPPPSLRRRTRRQPTPPRRRHPAQLRPRPRNRPQRRHHLPLRRRRLPPTPSPTHGRRRRRHRPRPTRPHPTRRLAAIPRPRRRRPHRAPTGFDIAQS